MPSSTACSLRPGKASLADLPDVLEDWNARGTIGAGFGVLRDSGGCHVLGCDVVGSYDGFDMESRNTVSAQPISQLSNGCFHQRLGTSLASVVLMHRIANAEAGCVGFDGLDGREIDQCGHAIALHACVCHAQFAVRAVHQYKYARVEFSAPGGNCTVLKCTLERQQRLERIGEFQHVWCSPWWNGDNRGIASPPRYSRGRTKFGLIGDPWAQFGRGGSTPAS